MPCEIVRSGSLISFLTYDWLNLFILLMCVKLGYFDFYDLQDVFLVKVSKKSTIVWRMVLLVFVMVCGVYICSIRLKEINTQNKTGFLDIQVIRKPCPEPNIEPWEIPYVHYPKPKTYSR